MGGVVVSMRAMARQRLVTSERVLGCKKGFGGQRSLLLKPSCPICIFLRQIQPVLVRGHMGLGVLGVTLTLRVSAPETPKHPVAYIHGDFFVDTPSLRPLSLRAVRRRASFVSIGIAPLLIFTARF